jgi:nitrite reductase/ring-hydroxylating ferredoxin subunit
MAWIDVLPLDELERSGKAVVRAEGRQILLLKTERGLYACANRCPHEGYPLSEGVLTDGCVLTCNWHNWKFNLHSGETLVGGDLLPRFPARVERGRVLVDIVPPDPVLRREQVLAGLLRALQDNDVQRLVREAARLKAIGADPLDAVRAAICWAAERLEFGTTHAHAGAADWIALHDSPAAEPDEKLAAIGEILGHLADDARDGRRFPFPEGSLAWDEPSFLAAIEREDEAEAITRLRGALAAGIGVDDLLPALCIAALAHYADFGHSLIYAVKTAVLGNRVGEAGTLLPLLARSLVYATREDLLPEFRDYAGHLANWGSSRTDAPPLAAGALRGKAPKAAMAIVAGWGAKHRPEAIFPILVEEATWTLLHVDDRALTRLDAPIADNVGWLDFTHALTFAESGLTAVKLRPALWPAVLLQLACFMGRNAGYVDVRLDTSAFDVAEPESFFATQTARLFDHGRDRFIISVHLLKTLLAGEALYAALPGQLPSLTPALNRFLNARMKGRHVLRTARQMRALVEQE